jgi:putative acetyltransferase
VAGQLSVRPIERRDASALADLTGAERDAWADALELPSGGAVHRLGAFVGAELRAAVELRPVLAARRRHAATLSALGGDQVALTQLVAEATTLADRWLGLARLEALVGADQPAALEALTAGGFVLEGWRIGWLARTDRTRFVDGAALARLRPGWTPPPAPPAPEADAPRVISAQITLRRSTPADADAVAAIMRDPRVLRGTLQLPSTSGDHWRGRVGAATSWLVEASTPDGPVVVGHGGLHVYAAPSAHVGEFGMAIAGAWQGAGIGRRLLAQLIDEARAQGLARLALEVYVDNPRAVRLYQGAGFALEGTRRAQAMCDGGYVDTHVMAMGL